MSSDDAQARIEAPEAGGSPDRPATVVELRHGFAVPVPAARPMMRWWWFGPDVEIGRASCRERVSCCV